MPRRRRIELKIVLETNAIFTDSENHLLRREISELVRNNRGDANLTIQWILPETVLQERSYQMQREAASLLPHLTRLERVTGLSLNITEETIRTKIAESVDRQVSEHRLIVLPASYDRIDWGRLVGDAVNRRPPFERKGEKGFRDALTNRRDIHNSSRRHRDNYNAAVWFSSPTMDSLLNPSEKEWLAEKTCKSWRRPTNFSG